MRKPPLLFDREPAAQIVLAVAVPTVFGLVTGIALSHSKGVYTVLALLATLGGIAAGFEHSGAEEGAGRGLAGGMLFGTLVLLGHAIAGGDAKVKLPDPHALFPVLTIIGGVLLGTLGGYLRGRSDRRAGGRPLAAD